MNKDEVLQRLHTQLAQLNRQFEVIRQGGAKIPKLEMDRMLGDIRATYELFTVLNYLNTYPHPEAQPVIPVTEKKAEEPVVIKEEIIAPLPNIPEPKPTPKEEKKEEKLVEVFMKDKPLSLHEKHAETPMENVAGKFRQQKIDDLRKAIPLHEKFMFINELFAGENVPYNQFIEAVNSRSVWDDASALLQQAKEKYQWDTGSKAYIKLADLIRRKF